MVYHCRQILRSLTSQRNLSESDVSFYAVAGLPSQLPLECCNSPSFYIVVCYAKCWPRWPPSKCCLNGSAVQKENSMLCAEDWRRWCRVESVVRNNCTARRMARPREVPQPRIVGLHNLTRRPDSPFLTRSIALCPKCRVQDTDADRLEKSYW